MTDSKATTVTRKRFEYEEDGHVAYLEFETTDSGWLTLWHTEVPEALRGRGIAGILARSAFDHARENNLRVDVICPAAIAFVKKNPEYNDLVGKKS
ncbi:GNAT family N-acetyltransferase [Silvibacterium sp.]|uniref:GNAT family N-acetyltransferase n=1 Tax=Silvibacterium sp. TaxID=1964179 RepID=UPI0039E680CC